MPHKAVSYTSKRGAKLFCLLTSLLLITVSHTAVAQNGTVSGTVRSAGSVLSHASVEVMTADGARAHASSDDNGKYRIFLPPGEYTVMIRLPGYTPRRTPGVRVSSGVTTTIDADLPFGPPELTRIVVTAARRSEKALDVAGSVSVVDEQAVRERVSTSPLDYVESTPGVDMAVQGLEGRQVVAHGFSGTFGPSLLLLSDYRNAALPSVRASLSYFLTPNGDDIDRVEVVRGPASALYGSNAADGVVHFITKSPFDSPGTNISVTGGGRSLVVGTGRYSAVMNDKFAWKLSGTYFRGTEWLAPPQPSETIARDPTTERANGEFRADYRITSHATAVFTAGSTIAMRNVEYTPIGTYQLDHSRADFAQLRFTDGSLFAQAYMNRASSPDGTTTNLQTGQSALDHSNVLVAQVQHGLNFRTTGSIIYGLDLQRTDPQTSGTVNGRNESHDKSLETGVYAQLSAPVASRLQLIAAARVDKHSQLDGAVFSPRLGFVFTPSEGQRFRVSYNRAFSTPTPGNLSLDVLAAKLDPLPYSLRAVGVPRSGFQFRRDCGGLCMSSPFAPGQALPLDATLLWPAVVEFF